jgi:DNA-binding response OmpR family regulator
VHLFSRGRPLLNRLAHESFDVIILDWMVPDLSGYDVLRTIRSQTVSDTPVLFLTHRDAEADVVAALEAGADDFLVKPARERELLARIKALGRRGPDREADADVLEAGPIRIDVGRREITCDGAPVDLLVQPRQVTRLEGRRRPGTARGTGCRLASALAGLLAQGASLEAAARGAKRVVEAYLDAAAG